MGHRVRAGGLKPAGPGIPSVRPRPDDSAGPLARGARRPGTARPIHRATTTRSMTRRWLKRLGYTVGALVALLLVAATAVYGFSEARFRKRYAVSHPVRPFTSDSALVARGAHLVQSYGGCIECHGENLAGALVIDDRVVGSLPGEKLPRGAGGVGGTRTDVRLERASRHGIGADGRPLKVMPSRD